VVSVVPVLVVVALIALDLWIYADATAHSQRGTPVVVSVGSFTVGTPAAWFVVCLFLSILFVPLYFAYRNR
jgi:hypothetical protein